MEKDYSEEVKAIIKTYNKENIVFGKDIDLLLKRVEASKEQIEEEIMSCNSLSFVKKQVKDNEIRYALFFIYGKKKGRQYVITFRNRELRIITVFTLGKKTLKKYSKKGLNI